MQLRLLMILVLLAASALCRSVSGVGGLHTVAADAYVQMAGNQGEFRAGERYPDFRAVCVVGTSGSHDARSPCCDRAEFATDRDRRIGFQVKTVLLGQSAREEDVDAATKCGQWLRG